MKILLLSILVTILGCDKLGPPKPQTVATTYDQANDKTHVDSPSMQCSAPPYTIDISSGFAYSGSAMAKSADEIDINIIQSPTGPGINSETIPASIFADGAKIETTEAWTSAKNGKRSFLISVSPASFGKIVYAKSANVALNGVTIPVPTGSQQLWDQVLMMSRKK